MTICISALIKDSEGNIVTRAASDSEVSYGSKRLRGISNSCEKVLLFPGACVSASGSGCVFEALNILQNDQTFIKKVQFRTREDIRDFAYDFFAQFNLLVESAKLNPEDANVGVLLITTTDKVFGVFADCSVFQFDEYFCSGSGADTAMGLMLAYYDDLGASPTAEDLERILTKAIEKTCAVESGCGLPVKLYIPPAPNPPVTKKARKKKVLTEDTNSAKLNSEELGERKSDNQSRIKRTGLP